MSASSTNGNGQLGWPWTLSWPRENGGMPSVVPHLQPQNNTYRNPFGSEVALFRTSEGGMSRMAVTWDIPVAGGERDAADDLEIRQRHQRGDDDGEDDAQQHGDAGAEDHAPDALTRRQAAAGHRDDDGVVARQQDVDPADFQNFGDRRPVEHGSSAASVSS